MTFVAAALFGLASLGSGASVSAADLTEEMVRKIAEEVAERVAREVAAEVAKQAAIEAVEEYNEDNAGEHTELEFTEEFLADPERIAAGKEIWDEQCALCHGARAYPGKAPKPNGFRKMPAWKDVYDDEERMDLVAWIKSRKFSP
jgi:mono/diheme cytochrome c family protein